MGDLAGSSFPILRRWTITEQDRSAENSKEDLAPTHHSDLPSSIFSMGVERLPIGVPLILL
jgi:hypothetical protein